MNIRILLIIFFSFFLYQYSWAQDTAKSSGKNARHSVKHANRNHINDSIKAALAKSHAHVKDSAKIHKTHSVKIPKYERYGYFAVLGGYGLPTGAYSSGGYASTGSIFSISAGFPGIISHCGIAFKFDYGTNSLNENQYINSLSNEIKLSDINYSFAGAAEKFSYKTFLTGLYLTYPSKYFSVDARVLGGVMLATYPAFMINIVDQTDGTNGTLIQSVSKGNAFAIDFGIDLRFYVRPKLSIMLSIDYLHADPSFTDVATGVASSSTGINMQDYAEATTSQAYSIFSLSVGVGYTISAHKATPKK